jgi:hypothetical protein
MDKKFIHVFNMGCQRDSNQDSTPAVFYLVIN